MIKSSPHFYQHATGGKTGYHRRARHNLASSAEKNGRKLIAVVLNVDNRSDIFTESKKLYDLAFNEKPVTKHLIPAGSQTFVCESIDGKEPIATFTEQSLSHTYYPSEEPEMRCQLAWDNVVAPVAKGTRVGEIQLFADGTCIKKIDLFAASATEKKLSIPLYWLAAGAGIILLGLFFTFGMRRRSY
jgi:D-alanyl-D-alanine carboxypeptidase